MERIVVGFGGVAVGFEAGKSLDSDYRRGIRRDSSWIRRDGRWARRVCGWTRRNSHWNRREGGWTMTGDG